MDSALSPSVTALADRLFAAIASGDIGGVEAIYAPDAAIWHNFDGVEQSVAENLRTLAWMSRTFVHLRYDEIRRQPLPDGFVQQHVLHAELSSGEVIAMPAAIFVHIRDGRIVRLEEYLDPSPVTVGVRRR